MDDQLALIINAQARAFGRNFAVLLKSNQIKEIMTTFRSMKGYFHGIHISFGEKNPCNELSWEVLFDFEMIQFQSIFGLGASLS